MSKREIIFIGTPNLCSPHHRHRPTVMILQQEMCSTNAPVQERKRLQLQFAPWKCPMLTARLTQTSSSSSIQLLICSCPQGQRCYYHAHGEIKVGATRKVLYMRVCKAYLITEERAPHNKQHGNFAVPVKVFDDEARTGV